MQQKAKTIIQLCLIMTKASVLNSVFLHFNAKKIKQNDDNSFHFLLIITTFCITILRYFVIFPNTHKSKAIMVWM